MTPISGVIASEAKQSPGRRANLIETLLSSEHFPEVRLGRRQVREDSRQLIVGDRQVALEDCREHGAVVGRYRQVAALIELGLRQAGPVGIDPAAAYIAAQHPDDIAVAVIGAAIAVLVN